MRIISGSAGGRSLTPPKNNRIRPTADRIKEALFSIIASRLGNFNGLRVLDLCAGTGNLGIEALSRGAESAMFVDCDHVATTLIRTNLKNLGFHDKGSVREISATSFLTRFRQTGLPPFDLVFFDPPYNLDLPAEVLPLLGTEGVVTASAIVVAEQAARTSLADAYGILTKFDQRTYGDTTLFLYAPSGSIPGQAS